MKWIRAASVGSVLVLSFITARAVSGQSAMGVINVKEEDGARNIEFKAAMTQKGGGEGEMAFSGPVDLPAKDDEESTERVRANLSMKVEFDCVVVEKMRASMSGIVREANLREFIGKTVLLSVEDGSELKGETDKFTWGFYSSQRLTWTPSDAELKFDDGWSMSWYVTDAERPDDRGELHKRPADVDCRSVSLMAYDEYFDLPRDGGDIQVRP